MRQYVRNCILSAAMCGIALLSGIQAVLASEALEGGAPAPSTQESEDYTGEIIDYPGKELWFDTTIYGGFMNAYEIVKSNGDDTFDMDAFINSDLGQLTLERIKDELCVLGDSQWGSETVIQNWRKKGVIEEIHRQGGNADNIDPTDKENIKDVYLTFVPDYMMEDGNDQTYPVVIDYHGGGGSLFESINHGFVHICYDNQFMVVCPEANGTETAYAEEHLMSLINELEQTGYPVDRSRIYLAGHSMGGIASIYGSLKNSDVIAAIAASGCSGIFGTTMSFDTVPTQELYDAANPVPMYLQIGASDNNQYPFAADVLEGINQWLVMNGCKEAVASSDNIFGFAADAVYEEEIDGTIYTFGDFNTANGNNMVKFAAVEGLPHWISPSYASLSWNFLKQYSRGEDGLLKVNGKAYDESEEQVANEAPKTGEEGFRWGWSVIAIGGGLGVAYFYKKRKMGKDTE